MSSVEDIEQAIERLPASELTRFRAWFEAFEATRFDDKISSDAAIGKFDRLADQALEAHRKGFAREL